MKISPLRNIVVINPEDIVKEEKTKSGLVVLKSDFNLYQFGNDEDRVASIIKKEKKNKGNVIACGDGCEFVKSDDVVIYKRNSEISWILDEYPEEYAVVEESDVLARMEKSGALTVNPDYIIVKITQESRDAVFSKKIVKEDGTVVDLFMDLPPDKDSDRASQFYVSAGTVVAVGSNVKDVHTYDTALLDYQVDNNENIIVGYQGKDKLMAVHAITTRHEDTNIIPATRNSKRDQMVWAKGDYNVLSKFIGVVRGSILIARDPYVFLAHESNVISKKTTMGIEYYETKSVLEREILACSEPSTEKFRFKKGERVVVLDYDIFDITFENKKISVVHDADIIMGEKLFETVKKSLKSKKYISLGIH